VRSRNQNADVGETFGNIPLDDTANSAVNTAVFVARGPGAAGGSDARLTNTHRDE
jgi:hypothetical protein